MHPSLSHNSAHWDVGEIKKQTKSIVYLSVFIYENSFFLKMHLYKYNRSESFLLTTSHCSHVVFVIRCIHTSSFQARWRQNQRHCIMVDTKPVFNTMCKWLKSYCWSSLWLKHKYLKQRVLGEQKKSVKKEEKNAWNCVTLQTKIKL